MTQRAEFQIQVLERLGVPLLTAVGGVSARTGSAPDLRGDAARLAELISRTVQMSVALSAALDIRDDKGQADGLRLALAGLSAPLVAGAYEMAGRIPAEADISRMAGTLGAVLAFADNFTPAAESTARLEGLEPGKGPAADEPQVHIQALFSLVPVVQAVAMYSFGRPDKKLMQEVSTRLYDRAIALRQRLAGAALSVPQQKRAELAIVRALGLLYAQSHAMETSRLMMMDDAARDALTVSAGGAVPMDGVWLAFDRGVEMLALTALTTVGGEDGPAFTAPPPQVKPSAPPAAPIANEGNPMAFFSSKTTGDGGEQG